MSAGWCCSIPIGWASDRMDRRKLIMGLSAVGRAGHAAGGLALPLPFPALSWSALLLGGITNPLYSLLIAYTNDFLTREEMAGGLGRADLPERVRRDLRPHRHRLDDGDRSARAGFFLFIGVLYVALAVYAAYRMTRRAAPAVTGAFRGVTPSASPLAVEAVLDEAGPRA